MSEIQDKINSGEILGKELILDLHNCNLKDFNKDRVEKFTQDLCDFIDMTSVEIHTWEYTVQDPDKTPEEFEHLKGCSTVLFLKTSNITIHTFDNLNRVSLNIYSCKNYDEKMAEEYCRNYFNAKVKQAVTILRY